MFRTAIYIITTIFLLQWCNCEAKEAKSSQTNELYDSIWLNFDKNNYDVAGKLAMKYLKEGRSKDGSFIQNRPKVYNILGYLSYLKYDLTMCLEYYELAIKFSQNHEFTSLEYGNIANIFLTQGDFNKATIYYNKALTGVDTNNYVAISNNYSNLGIAYYNLGQWERSIEVTKKSIDISEKKQIGNIGDKCNTCAIAYLRIGNYQQAGYYFKKSIQHYRDEFGDQHFKTATGIGNYADLLLEQGNMQESLVWAENSYKILINTLGNKHPLTSDRLKTIGQIYNHQKSYSKALDYFQKSLISRVYSFNNTSIYANPGEQVFVNPDLLELLKLKANTLEKLSEIKDKEKNLSASLSALKLAISYLEKLRTGYLSEDSKLLLTKSEYEIYSDGVRISAKLYELSGDNQYFNLAFEFVEFGKYGVLRELVNNEYARGYAGIPNDISEKERNLVNQITSYRVMIESENSKEKSDSNSLATLHEKLFVTTRKLEKLKEQMESEFPDYYRIKYNSRVSSLKDLQNYLTDNQSVLEYTIQDDQIYIFLINNTATQLHIEPIDSIFYYYLGIYEKILHTEYSIKYSLYKNSAAYLYRKLLLPVEKLLKDTKELVIIPDAMLSKVSFETFLTEDYQENSMKMYQIEPYLLRKYAIGYSFSSSLLVNSQNNKFSIWRSFIGFAPEYRNSPDSLENISEGYTSIRKIARMFLGRTVIKNKATETRFKKENNYNIISFYTHGIDDTLNASLSRMYFSKSKDSINDGYLYSYEVSSMQIKSNLVALVTCFSGSGTVSKGEGVMSIGRSFANAGCPSMVLSLWSASAEPSYKIMKEFYWNLIKGKSKPEALRIAKLKYLDQNDLVGAHPRFWAGIILIGNTHPIFNDFILKAYILPFGTVLTILIIVLLRRRLRKLF